MGFGCLSHKGGILKFLRTGLTTSGHVGLWELQNNSLGGRVIGENYNAYLVLQASTHGGKQTILPLRNLRQGKYFVRNILHTTNTNQYLQSFNYKKTNYSPPSSINVSLPWSGTFRRMKMSSLVYSFV